MKVRLRVYGPLLVAGLFWGGLEGKAGVVGFCALFAAGVLIWTLLEYLIHRFAFHGFAPHWQHHHDPIDPAFILAPLWLSLSASGVLWVLLSVAAHSAARGALMAAGIVAGYLAYELVHLRIHGRAGAAGLAKTSLLSPLRQRPGLLRGDVAPLGPGLRQQRRQDQECDSAPRVTLAA